jgi:Trypsin-like peptidase domain
MTPSEQAFEKAKRAVVQIGDGRGFVVGAGEYDRYVITAAHCLPHHPPPHLANGVTELTYKNLIGPLAKKRRTIWAGLVVDNLADDVAVLAEPDGQELYDECANYEKFTTAAMMIGKPPTAVASHEWGITNGTAAWVLSLDRKWQPCLVHNGGRFLIIQNRKIEGGMSGSPIIDANGAAIGLVSTGIGASTSPAINPSLMDCLPPWLLRKLDTATRPSIAPRRTRATPQAPSAPTTPNQRTHGPR